MAEYMAELSNDRLLAKNMGIAGSKGAMAYFNMQKHIETINTLVENIHGN